MQGFPYWGMVGNPIISIYFSVRLWIKTQFNTPKNEMSLKVYSQACSLKKVSITLLTKIVCCGLSLCFS